MDYHSDPEFFIATSGNSRPPLFLPPDPRVPLWVRPSQSLPNKQVSGCWVGAGQAEGSHSRCLLSVAPGCPPPIICPGGGAHGPNERSGTERKEGANCSCDVGVVPFTMLSMATGQRPWKHAAPLSGQRPGGREAAGSPLLHSPIPLLPAYCFTTQKISQIFCPEWVEIGFLQRFCPTGGNNNNDSLASINFT